MIRAVDRPGVRRSWRAILAVIHFYRATSRPRSSSATTPIELNPHFAPAYWILGVIQEQRKDFDESAAAFQRAVHLSPQTPRMHGALGRTFALSGRRKQALEVLRKLESVRQGALRVAARVRLDSVRAWRRRPRLPLDDEGVRGPRLRPDLDQGGSALRFAAGRSPFRRDSRVSSASPERSRGLDLDHRPLVPVDLREHVEDLLQEILSIEQFVRGEPIVAFDQRRRPVEPRALDVAAHACRPPPAPAGCCGCA
jgi:tetratricopeptide (TPR) repeat protein